MLYVPVKKFASEEKRVRARNRLGIGNRVVVVEKVETSLDRMGAALHDQVVDNLTEIIQSRRGEEVERPKVATPRDSNRRADLIVRRSIQIVVAELAAGFIKGVGR